MPIALILIFALGSLGIYGFIVGGWASESKYALLGSMRTCAQLVSYEVSLALRVLGVVLMAQSLSLVDIVAAQDGTFWYVVPQFVGFVVFLLAGIAETPRAPFDLPEAEHGARRRLPHRVRRHALRPLHDAEYINLIMLSGLARDALPRRLARARLGLPRPALVPAQAASSCSSSSSGCGRRCRACATTS